jgi:predicted esterase
MRWILATVLAILITAVICTPHAVKADAGDATALDPMQASAGDFLDADLDALEKAARDAYDAKDYKAAAQFYLELLRHDIRNGVIIYNLARCYGMLGDAGLASRYLERSARTGFDACSQAIWDPDFESVRDTPIFDETLRLLYELAKQDEINAKGKLKMINAPSYKKCYVHLPDDYDPAKKYTLLIGLHGYGDNADNFTMLWEGFTKHDFIFAVLEAPYPVSSAGALTYSWTVGMPEDEKFWEQAALASSDYVVSAAAQLQSEYSVGETYLLGFSQGATMAYVTGVVHHNSINGLICIAGSLEAEIVTDADLAAAKNLRIFIAHGDKDDAIALSASEAARDRLLALGYDVNFLKFAGTHRISVGPLQAAERWMKHEL